VPAVRAAGALGLRIDLRPGLLVLRSDQALDLTKADARAGRVRQRARLRAGEAVAFSLTFEDEWPAILPPIGAWSRDCLDRSIAWWSDWIGRMDYDGPYRATVARSALVLRLLLHAPSGSFVAAPTTSLPERVAGALNWDYRFCWLRDASLTMRALFALGFHQEGEALLGWLLHTTRLTRPELRVLYDVYGRPPPRERALPHLHGYRGSRPVRIGNAASEQLQLDVYGEVLDAAAQFAAHGGTFDRETQRLLAGFGHHVARNWRRPDEGLWEPRSGRRHNTHSHLLCWVALDRLATMHRTMLVGVDPIDDILRAREEIAAAIRQHAWNAELGSYASTLGGAELDASTLLLAWYGFEDAASDRMRASYARITSQLGAGRGLLYRYRNGESPGEGAFGVCGFWAAEYLALGGGTVDEARAAFEGQLGFENDVGLYAEEIDPATGAFLGNLPQALSHLSLISAAVAITEGGSR
jgi:GH15 family glucan-1,4-alpha-glucosidase